MPIGTIQKYDATKRSRKGGIIISPAIDGVSEWDLDTPLSIDSYGEYTITCDGDITVLVKMWGAAGGCNGFTTFYPGGGGGYTEGIVTLTSGSTYTLFIGEAGQKAISPDGERITVSGGGGGASALVLNSSPILVAGGGGGSGGRTGGAGGGIAGQSADGAGGKGGTQSSAGGGGQGSRRNGAAGSGANGGKGAPVDAPVFSLGGRGYGKGGDGVYFYSDGPSGGGGSGYFGGGGGGGDSGGYGGGGGSGYYNPSLVTSGITEVGVYDVPARATDSNRGDAGATVSSVPQDGKIIISLA